MYTEMVKIIEAGIALDRKKVMRYATVFADNLVRSGDMNLANRIRAVVSRTHGVPVALDSLGAKPVDGESHMEIVDVTYPAGDFGALILDRFVEDEVRDFVASYAKRDELFRLGAEVSNSLLLYGPPGCGKTSVAKLIAAQTGLPLVTARFDTLVSSLLGSTSKNIRQVFEYAARMPCVLFLDEFDVIAKMRDDKNELGELKRVVNGLLQEMDAFSPESILIAATNHHELLDKAVWRRFGKILMLAMPSGQTIERLLRMNLDGRDDGFLSNRRAIARAVAALVGCSHSGVKTVAMNALKSAVVAGRGKVSVGILLKESYLFKHHAIADDRKYVAFLLRNGFSIRCIHNDFGLPLRMAREVSLELNKGGKA